MSPAVEAARITAITPQLRTTDLDASIGFYTGKLGFTLGFRWQDFYAGICAGEAEFHLKLVDAPDPSIDYVAQGDHVHLYFQAPDVEALAAEFRARGVTLIDGPVDRPWDTREIVLRDDQGHTLYFSQPLNQEESK
ncbi:VOC family protein [Falsiroseomonas sp. HC035]|uniref:VOC family protein n=1 Tax=Falsiroseomonas sp. HC035 TaxID=3390999 RepID=UPI003D31648A